MGGGSNPLPPHTLTGCFRKNFCKDDSALFSRFPMVGINTWIRNTEDPEAAASMNIVRIRIRNPLYYGPFNVGCLNFPLVWILFPIVLLRQIPHGPRNRWFPAKLRLSAGRRRSPPSRRPQRAGRSFPFPLAAQAWRLYQAVGAATIDHCQPSQRGPCRLPRQPGAGHAADTARESGVAEWARAGCVPTCRQSADRTLPASQQQRFFRLACHAPAQCTWYEPSSV